MKTNDNYCTLHVPSFLFILFVMAAAVAYAIEGFHCEREAVNMAVFSHEEEGGCGNYEDDESCEGECTAWWYSDRKQVCSGEWMDDPPPCQYCNEFHYPDVGVIRLYAGTCDWSGDLNCHCYVSDFDHPIGEPEIAAEIFTDDGVNCYMCR